MKKGIVVLLSASLALSAAHAAFAQAPAAASTDSVTQARQHFARGVKLYEEEDFRAALIEFKRAYELAPNSSVLYNIGQSHYQLREYVNALKTLETYVKQAGDQIPKDKRPQVDREVEELRGRVAHVAITVNVDGADVSLDDAPLGKAPFAEAQLIGAGRHTLAASKAGYRSVSKVVDIAGGDTLTLPIEIAAEAPEDRATPARERPSYAPAVITGVLGIAGVAVGTVFGLEAMGNKSSLNDACTNKVCPASSQKDIDAFSRNGAISTVGFGVGVVGIAASAFFFIRAQSDEPQTGGVLRPWIGLGAGGVAGRF